MITPGFYGHEKKPLLQMKYPVTGKLLGRVDESLELNDEIKPDVKSFIISKVCCELTALICGEATVST